METKIIMTEFRGNAVLSIYELDDNGEEKKGYDGKSFPLVNFGAKKAAAIMNHIEEIKDFAFTYINNKKEK